MPVEFYVPSCVVLPLLYGGRITTAAQALSPDDRSEDLPADILIPRRTVRDRDLRVERSAPWQDVSAFVRSPSLRPPLNHHRSASGDRTQPQ